MVLVHPQLGRALPLDQMPTLKYCILEQSNLQSSCASPFLHLMPILYQQTSPPFFHTIPSILPYPIHAQSRRDQYFEPNTVRQSWDDARQEFDQIYMANFQCRVGTCLQNR